MSTDVPIDTARAGAPAPARRRVRTGMFSQASLRMLHSYVSAFIAPTVVFFAITGALQILDLHESHGAYKASAIMSSLGRLHKQQVFAPEKHRPPAAASGRSRPADEAGPQPGVAARPEPPVAITTQLLKALFVTEAVALVLTTALGVWIGVTHAKRARRFWYVIAAGTVIPVLLLLL